MTVFIFLLGTKALTAFTLKSHEFLLARAHQTWSTTSHESKKHTPSKGRAPSWFLLLVWFMVASLLLWYLGQYYLQPLGVPYLCVCYECYDGVLVCICKEPCVGNSCYGPMNPNVDTVVYIFESHGNRKAKMNPWCGHPSGNTTSEKRACDCNLQTSTLQRLCP